METAHWMVNCSSMVNLGKSPAMAWSASMTFAELEGCRNVMVVDMPGDQETISKTWGLVVGKMRQIHVLFFTSEAMKAVSSLENMEEDDFLSRSGPKRWFQSFVGLHQVVLLFRYRMPWVVSRSTSQNMGLA